MRSTQKVLRTTGARREKKKNWNFLRVVGLITIATVSVFYLYKFSTYLYKEGGEYVAAIVKRYTVMAADLESNSKTNSKTVEGKVLSSLKKHIELPPENVSLIFKVKDSKALDSQAEFYKSVKNGDYVVIYPSMAIIYDFDSDKIIKISNLDKK